MSFIKKLALILSLVSSALVVLISSQDITGSALDVRGSGGGGGGEGDRVAPSLACPRDGNYVEPRVLWAQREELLYIRVIFPKLSRESFSMGHNDTHLTLAARAQVRSQAKGDGAGASSGGSGVVKEAGSPKSESEGETVEERDFCLSLAYFRRVESSVTQLAFKSDEVMLTVAKKWRWMYWPRLLRSPKDPLKSKVGVDWKRWKGQDEGEDDDNDATPLPPGQRDEDDWLDDEVAATKVASFPEEEYDDTRVPLLDAKTLKTFLEANTESSTNLTLIHVFERGERCKRCRQLSMLLSHVANQIHLENRMLSIGRIDGPANWELMKKLHVTSYPQLKLFFSNGDTYDVDVNAIRNSRQLQYYLIEQMQNAWIDSSTVTTVTSASSSSSSGSASSVLANQERVVLFVVDDIGAGAAAGKKARAERTFEGVAKRFRAQVVKQTNIVFVKASASALLELPKVVEEEGGANLIEKRRDDDGIEEDTEEEDTEDGDDGSNTKMDNKWDASLRDQIVHYLSEAQEGKVEWWEKNSTGDGLVLVLKKGEEPWRYRTVKWKVKALFNWVRRAQFNLVEQITPANFPEFRRRGIPMLYILLAGGNSLEDSSEADAQNRMLLESVKQIAKETQRKVSFVYTFVNGTDAADLLGHLRCEFTGASFAVLEDFQEEYRYCVEASLEKPLTSGRITRLVQGFLSQDRNVIHNPDKLRSEPIPKENYGPVYDVVGDNLLQIVLDPKKDVVIHFYSPMDEKWDYDETELKKVAEVLEDVESIFIGKIDGFKNEKPREFPEIGYFPCTYIFTMNNKMHPIEFNKTEGFVKPRLLDWIRRHASKPEELLDELEGSELNEADGETISRETNETDVPGEENAGIGLDSEREKLVNNASRVEKDEL